jgi:hypothetical protein
MYQLEEGSDIDALAFPCVESTKSHNQLTVQVEYL